MAMKHATLIALILALVGAAAFGGGPATAGSLARASQAQAAGSSGSVAVDPRGSGLEIVLGEWALSPEARAIRPGRVTFVIRNRGRFRHGFEIGLRRDGGRSGDSDDGWESMELRPGQTTTLTLDLSPGEYEIECSVGDHDEMGMRSVLEVREDAPFVVPRPAATGSTVEIARFAFAPATLRAKVGSVVTWRNSDAAPHTATGRGFSSPRLRKGASFRYRFTRAGSYAYVCALHPGMRGRILVAGRGSG